MNKRWNKFCMNDDDSSPYSDWRTMTLADEYYIEDKFTYWRPVRITASDERFAAITAPNFPLFTSPQAFRMSDHYRDLLNEEEVDGETKTIVIQVANEAITEFRRDFNSPFPASKDTTNEISMLQADIEIGPPVSEAIFGIFNDCDGSEHGSHALEKLTVDDGAVIMAIVDDVIGFANEAFRKSLTSTRIEAIWLMGATKRECDEVSCGVVLYKQDIDSLLEKFCINGVVDENAIYQHLEKEYDFGIDLYAPVSHGTHVLDLMAGTDFRIGLEEDNLKMQPIIAAILPRHAVQDSSGTENEFFVQEATDWIVSVANKIQNISGKPLPLVTNFSFGLYAGPHDGTSKIEQAIGNITKRRLVDGTAVVSVVTIPAGNSFQSQTHAFFELGPDAKKQILTWEIPPENKLSSFIEIWLPVRDITEGSGIKLTITTPDGDVLEEKSRVCYGQGYEWTNGEDIDKKLFLRTYHQSFPTQCDDELIGRERVMIALLPTKSPDAIYPTIPSGDWKLEIEFLNNFDFEEVLGIDAWIQRGGSVFGHPLIGRQSIFTDANYKKIDDRGFSSQKDNKNSAIRREGTLNALATASGAIAVGGYLIDRGDSSRPATDYTSSGSKKLSRQNPHVSAPTEQGVFTHGVLATGTYSGTTVALGGTSTASPQVAALVARAINDGHICPNQNPREIVMHMAQQQNTDTIDGTVPDSLEKFRLGAGRLEHLEYELLDR